MTKLSDTQAIILSNAAHRERPVALPLPPTRRGGAAQKVVNAMLSKGLLVLAPARADDPRWDDTDDGTALTTVATDAGLAAIGLCTEDGQPREVHTGNDPDRPDAETAPNAAPQRLTDAPEPAFAPKPRARGKAAQAAPTSSDGATTATPRAVIGTGCPERAGRRTRPRVPAEPAGLILITDLSGSGIDRGRLHPAGQPLASESCSGIRALDESE